MDTEDINRLNATEYKKYHESFMQNNEGTSAIHVFFCIFFTVQCSIYSSLKLKKNSKYNYFYEYIIIVLPLILAHTVLPEYIYLLNAVIFTMLLYEIRHHLYQLLKVKPQYKRDKLVSISLLRSLTYLITVFAILAVDFQSFPRYLAKTERYGNSLMDTGVGLFVLMSGLVHKDLQTNKLSDILKSNFKFITLLLFLGIARYFSIQNLDYPEHVTEYGVHWNFFFTLAICKLLSTIILYYIPNNFMLGLYFLAVHEMILYCGLQDWVFSDAVRDNFLSANREGVSSCLGYVSMYIFAAWLREMLKDEYEPMPIKMFNKLLYFNSLHVEMTLITAFFWISLAMVNYIIPASRTLANASYCLYLESVLVTIFSVLLFIETLVEDGKTVLQMPKILENINDNGLFYFLVANLLTGAVNLSMRTLAVSTGTTFIILNCYMILTISFVTILSMGQNNEKEN